MCCIQAVHKFVSVYCHGTEILTKEDILSCSSTPSPASQETFRFKACTTILAKARGIFTQNAEVYFSILIHFKFIETPKSRVNLTQSYKSIAQIHGLTSSQNYVSWSYTETAVKNHEFHATHRIKREFAPVLPCSTAHPAIRKRSFFPTTFPSLLHQLTAFML